MSAAVRLDTAAARLYPLIHSFTSPVSSCDARYWRMRACTFCDASLKPLWRSPSPMVKLLSHSFSYPPPLTATAISVKPPMDLRPIIVAMVSIVGVISYWSLCSPSKPASVRYLRMGTSRSSISPVTSRKAASAMPSEARASPC